MIGLGTSLRCWTMAAVAALLLAAPAVAQTKPVVIGVMCDRSGAMQNVGMVMCPGSLDYAALINTRGGIEGRPIKPVEIDTGYTGPRSLEAYEQFKKDGATSVLLFGTPATLALTPKLNEDRIPGTAPGFGSGASVDGRRYPYVFPIAATYWSQAAGAVKFAKDRLGGTLSGKKIAYLFGDNVGGKEALPLLEDLAKSEGFELRTYAVPPPGLDLTAPVLDIVRAFRADFVITNLFGRSPSQSIRELRRFGYPMAKVIALAWGSIETDIEAAGPNATEGYSTIQLAGVGSDYQIHKDIAQMYRRQNKPAPKEMGATAYYNRGLFHMAMHVEAIRNVFRAKGPGAPFTGEDVKNGFEKIRAISLGGLMPPMELSPADHEGGGWVQVYTVKGNTLAGATDWFRAYPEAIRRHVEAAAARR